tara:strand:- start:807 stop:1658 length:852 start_codon:yes stop_codon:yes gene_type:complete
MNLLKDFEFAKNELASYWIHIPRLELGRHLLKIDLIRYFACRIRFENYIREGNKIRIFKEGEHVRKNVIDNKDTAQYNLESLTGDFSSARSSRIIRPLSCIEHLFPKRKTNRTLGVLSDIDTLSEAKVLAIGPRNEAELFLLHAYGFALNKIRGFDLISYGDMIDCGDMHNMPYADNEFDVVICSCTLPYSMNPKIVCSEIRRITKDKGICGIMNDVIGSKYRDETIEEYGYPMYSPEDILEMFKNKNCNFNVIWRHFPEEYVDTENGATSSIIFQLNKGKTV